MNYNHDKLPLLNTKLSQFNKIFLNDMNNFEFNIQEIYIIIKKPNLEINL